MIDRLWVWDNTLSFDNIRSSLYVLFVNVFIFGSDQRFTILFDRQSFDMVIATPTSWADKSYVKGIAMHVVPQIWSVSTELYFYLLSPLLFRKGKVRNVLFATCFVLSLGYYCGVGHITSVLSRNATAWVAFKHLYDCLWMFLLGCIAYRCYAAARNWGWFTRATRVVGTIALLAVIGATFAFRHIDKMQIMAPSVLYASYILLTAISLPFIYGRWERTAWDRNIGDLSYAVYLVHYGIGDCLAMIGVKWVGVVTVLLSTVIAWVLVRHVEGPLTRWRHLSFRPDVVAVANHTTQDPQMATANSCGARI